MKKLLFILVFTFITAFSFSQGYRFTLSTNQAYFGKFDQKPMYFSGISGEYAFLLKRFGVHMSVGFYMPRKYYGTVKFYDFNVFADKAIRANARGGGNSIGLGISYDVVNTKSEKLKIAPEFGVMFFNHTATYNKEPFVKVYGSAYDISISLFTIRTGINTIFKLGNTPVSCSLSRCNKADKMEYDSFNVTSYYELKIGVAFPILITPRPDKIIRITY